MTHNVIEDDYDTARAPGGSRAAQPPPEVEDEEKDRFLGLSVPQLLGGAGAAVSSAVVASYLGVAGTLVGAALGSVVSTVSAALYTNSLRSAHHKLPPPRLLSGRVDAGGVSSTPERATTPAPVPTPRMARDPRDDGSYVVTVGSRGARRMRAVRRLVAGMVAVFVLAVAALTAIELGLGHPVSAEQDKGGTSIGTVVGTSPEPASTPTPTTTPTSQPEESPTQQPTEQTSVPASSPATDAPSPPAATTDQAPAATTQAPAPDNGAPAQEAPAPAP